MATATSAGEVRSCDAFSAALTYSLDKLGLPQVCLKEEQRAAIKAVYQGRDVFVCLPTGYGKSLCYQTLPFVIDYGRSGEARNSAVLVVSPLIALMEDQVGGLRRRGVKASVITSSAGVSKDNMCTDESLCTDSIFFCSPEALATSKWREAFDILEFSERIVAVVVDEAHCVAKW